MDQTQAMDSPVVFRPVEAEKRSEKIIPPSAERVARHTAPHVQKSIRMSTVDNIYRAISSPEKIDFRLRELDREWDVERVLELNAATLAFTGVVLGRLVDRRWLYLSMAVTAFLAQHALQGWCPPLPVLRRLGVRTRREIEQERHALKTIRGDSRELPESIDPQGRAEELLAIQER